MKMKRFLIRTALAAIAIIYFNRGYGQSKSELTEAKKAIEVSNSIYFSSFIKNNADIFADRYAGDCIIMAPNSQSYKGRKGALDFFKMGYDAGLRNGKFITEAVYGDGKEYVTEMGQWQSIDAKGKITDDGKFLVLWKRTPNGWKMFRDSFSSNHPVAK